MKTTNSLEDPALLPPVGVSPNFVDPYSQNPAFVATAVLCILLATASVVVRLTTRLLGSTKRLRFEECKSLYILMSEIVSASYDADSIAFRLLPSVLGKVVHTEQHCAPEA